MTIPSGRRQTRARAALQDWCTFNIDEITLLHTGHSLADASGFARALDSLPKPAMTESRRIDGCRAHDQAAMDDAFQKLQALVASRRFDEATRALDVIDARFGGLAAPPGLQWRRAIATHTGPHR